MANLIYSRILELAKQQRLSIAKVEAGAGLGNGTIRKWEKGNPSIDNLEKVAGVLGVELEDLIKKESK